MMPKYGRMRLTRTRRCLSELSQEMLACRNTPTYTESLSLMLIIVGTKLQINFNQRGKLAAPRGM